MKSKNFKILYKLAKRNGNIIKEDSKKEIYVKTILLSMLSFFSLIFIYRCINIFFIDNDIINFTILLPIVFISFILGNYLTECHKQNIKDNQKKQLEEKIYIEKKYKIKKTKTIYKSIYETIENLKNKDIILFNKNNEFVINISKKDFFKIVKKYEKLK
jgi:hypothetical protein